MRHIVETVSALGNRLELGAAKSWADLLGCLTKGSFDATVLGALGLPRENDLGASVSEAQNSSAELDQV